MSHAFSTPATPWTARGGWTDGQTTGPATGGVCVELETERLVAVSRRRFLPFSRRCCPLGSFAFAPAPRHRGHLRPGRASPVVSGRLASAIRVARRDGLTQTPPASLRQGAVAPRAFIYNQRFRDAGPSAVRPLALRGIAADKLRRTSFSSPGINGEPAWAGIPTPETDSLLLFSFFPHASNSRSESVSSLHLFQKHLIAQTSNCLADSSLSRLVQCPYRPRAQALPPCRSPEPRPGPPSSPPPSACPPRHLRCPSFGWRPRRCG